jgi:hypothetical protein
MPFFSPNATSHWQNASKPMPLVRKKRKRTQFSRPCTEAEEHSGQQRFLDPNKIEILVVILVLGCVIGLAFLFLFRGANPQ